MVLQLDLLRLTNWWEKAFSVSLSLLDLPDCTRWTNWGRMCNEPALIFRLDVTASVALTRLICRVMYKVVLVVLGKTSMRKSNFSGIAWKEGGSGHAWNCCSFFHQVIVGKLVNLCMLFWSFVIILIRCTIITITIIIIISTIIFIFCTFFVTRAILDHNNGKILSTMEWSMVFVKVPMQLMVFLWFFHNWTIAIEWMVLRLTIVIDGMVNGF